MEISATERELRRKAAQSALASVRNAGLEPSQQIETLFTAWIDGNTSLDDIYASLIRGLGDITMIDAADITISGRARLQNKLGINDPGRLRRAEADLTAFRLAELRTAPTRGGFDSAHLQQIHRPIYQDLYDWAGELRPIDGDGLSSSKLPRSLDKVFDRLRAENHLKDLDHNLWASRATQYVHELGNLQPFLAGNGATLREFAAELARENSLGLQWKASPEIGETQIALRREEHPRIFGASSCWPWTKTPVPLRQVEGINSTGPSID
jgi:cell filamentation protein